MAPKRAMSAQEVKVGDQSLIKWIETRLVYFSDASAVIATWAKKGWSCAEMKEDGGGSHYMITFSKACKATDAKPVADEESKCQMM